MNHVLSPDAYGANSTPLARILIAVEEPREAIAIETMLESSGYTDIRATTDMREVVPFLNLLAFDLMILDMHSVMLDSVLLLHRLPEEAVNVRIETLAVINPGHEPARLNALIAGAYNTISRPIQREDLIGKVDMVLRPQIKRYGF